MANGPVSPNILVKQKGPNKRHAQTLPSDSLSAKQVKICQEYVKNTSFFTCALKVVGLEQTCGISTCTLMWVMETRYSCLFFFFVKTFCNQMQPIFLFLFSLSLSLKIVLCTPWNRSFPLEDPWGHQPLSRIRRKSAYLYQEILDGLTSAPSSAA